MYAKEITHRVDVGNEDDVIDCVLGTEGVNTCLEWFALNALEFGGSEEDKDAVREFGGWLAA